MMAMHEESDVLKSGGYGHIQSEYEKCSKEKKSYNTTLGEYNNSVSQLDSNVSSIDCTNHDVINESNRDKISNEKLKKQYNLLSDKWLRLDGEYATC